MAHLTKLSFLAAAFMATELIAVAGESYLEVYDGTRPATPEAPITDQVLLVTVPIGELTQTDGVITSEDIAPAVIAETGIATWFRWISEEGDTLGEGEVGLSGSDLNLSTTSLISGNNIDLSTFTFTLPGV